MTQAPESRSARERVYEALKAGPGTRPELASRTGLSVVSVIAAVDELASQKLAVLEDTPPPSGRGRPAARVRLNTEGFRITALDLGSPTVACGRYNLLAEPEEVQQFGNPYQLLNDQPEHNLNLIQQWLSLHGPADVVAISMVGSINPRTRTVTHPVLGFHDFPLEARLSERMGCPVLLENDANLAAWHTWHHLEMQKEDPLAFLNYSYGLGLGLMLGGQMYHGATGGAGEISFAADPSKRVRHQPLAERLIGHLQEVNPSGSIEEVSVQAAQGDRRAKQALRLYVQDLANHLTAVVAMLDPAILVLQDIPHAAEPLLQETLRALSELHLPTRVMVSPLGPLGGLDSAGAYGAQWLERQKLFGSTSEN